ncbi:EAL domain-containing protein [Cryobacterium frigoriphilum]|uniref:EAL domain-containing protein n=1 Tax=Cryobacterium frigoriphilum TaxID=1259150 RepID=UPI00141AC682|nr:EAL domain-containing protein [Cryobacterium frigoriphilum]
MTRPVFVVFAVLALTLMVISAQAAIAAPGHQWPLIVLGVLCAAALEIPKLQVGSVRHRTPVITLPVIALLALETVLPLRISVGVIVTGVLVIEVLRTQRWAVALYRAGLTGVGGVVCSLVYLGLNAPPLSVPVLITAAVASISYVAFVIAVGTFRMRYTKDAFDLGGRPMLSTRRVLLVGGGYAAVAAAAAQWNHAFADGSSQSIGVVVVLLALTLLAATEKLVIRSLIMRRRLVGMIAGVTALNASTFLETPRRDVSSDGGSGTDAATDITEMLCRAVSTTVGVESVTVRDAPPAAGEIGVVVALTAGTEQFVVAHRDPMDRGFTRDDELALRALAQTADAVVTARSDIGGLIVRANTDPLTGLPNYGAFQVSLANINEHRNYEEALAVLFLDLDDFKRLNDRYGHQAGDSVLHELGRRLRRAVGPHDVVARVGGDEFIVILTRLTSLSEAKAMAEQILADVGQPLTVGLNHFTLVLSMGLAYSAQQESDVSLLIHDADQSMLAVKRSRRAGGPSNESSLSISEHRSTAMDDLIAHAIDDDLLELAFQPIVSLVTNQIWAFEALVRYTDAELGPVSPPALVEKAKSLGRLDALTRQVAIKAMRAAADFRLEDSRIVCMTFNVEAAQIVPARLGDFVEILADRYPEISLCLELNERSVAKVSAEIRAQVEHLRDAGIMIALDDYGSEDSSVDALVRLPMDILKIDRSLVDDLADIRQREVLTALQGFGDKLEYSMIVEGVENAFMAEQLNMLGIRAAQGFHYGMPQSYEVTRHRLERFGAAAIVPTELPAAVVDEVARRDAPAAAPAAAPRAAAPAAAPASAAPIGRPVPLP